MMLSLHLCVRSFRRGTGQTIASAPKGPSKLVLSKRGPCTGRPNGRDPDPCNVFSTSGGAWCSLDKHRRRSESRAIKLRKHSTYRQVAEAEQAAANKDQRGLYSVIRRLKSKGRQRASRLQNQDFTPMTPEQEMQAVLQYSRSTFSCLPDAQVPAPLLEGLSLSDAEYAAQLKGLGLRKAVPEHVAPTAVWRLCAHEISAILGPALREHFGEGCRPHLDEDWTAAYISWLPKPGKRPEKVGDMRPIGLMCPSSKALAGALRQKLAGTLQQLLRWLPEFAYTRGRGTMHALIKVHHHFLTVSDLLKANKVDRFQKYQGRQARQCCGGISMSLDLSKAFDKVHRPKLYASLADNAVDQTTISVLQSVHQQAQYRFRVGHLIGSIVTQNGIKQGCKAAPYLWSFFSIAIMQRLVDCRSQEWLQRVCTLFADDRWTNWVITCEQDLRQAIRDIELVLQVLEDFCLEVNYRKTAVMLRLEGPQTRALLREFTYEQAGVEYLNVTVNGSHRGVPIKAQHEYLGSTVGYHRRHNLNVAKRAASAQVKYLDIKKALNGRHLLSISHRLRLWQACIYTSVMYSVPVVGVTNKGNSQLYKLTTKHLRALTGQPAHTSHCPNRTIWDRSALKPPAELAVQLLENFLTDLRHSRSLQSDITNTAQLEDYVQNVIASFKSLPAHPPTHSAVLDHQGDKVPCPECGQECVSENAMRIHCKLVHKYTPAHSTRKPTVFVPHVHAKFGLPQCSLCDRKFFRWGNLKAHIRTGACVACDSLIRHPKEDEHLQAGRPSQSTADGLPATLPKNSEPEAFELNMPLVLRPSFLRVLPSWDSFLRTPGSKQLLNSRCVLCNMWIADAKHIKQHYHKVHHQEHPDLEAKAHNLCKPFRWLPLLRCQGRGSNTTQRAMRHPVSTYNCCSLLPG